MACYDDVDFVRQCVHHAAIACDEYADFIFDVPVAPDGDSDDDYMEASLSRDRTSLHRTRTTRERRLGLNILEDYRNGTFLGDRGDRFDPLGFGGETISTITSDRDRSFSSFYNPRFGGSFSKRTSYQFNRNKKRGSDDVKAPDHQNNALLPVEAVEKNKIITWTECPIDSEKLAFIIKEKKVFPKKSESGNENDLKTKKEKPPSPFVKAVEVATSVPVNPLASFYQYISSDPDVKKGSIRNEFRVVVNLDENPLDELDVSKLVNIRFVPSCRVHNLIGLILYLHSISGSNKSNSSVVDLPSYNVEDYQLLGLGDEEDDPEIEAILLDNNSKADQYQFPFFILQYRGTTGKSQQSSTLPITVHIHMLGGPPLTNTIKIHDRYTPLRHIHEEGMKYFFKDKPNYGAPYVMVSYTEQDRGVLDLNQTLMDTKTRSFQLRRVNCKAANLHDVSSHVFIDNSQLKRFDCLLLNSSSMKKKDNRVMLTYSCALIELHHVTSHAVIDDSVSMFSSSPNIKLASWMPEQVARVCNTFLCNSSLPH